jgi:hypothetical protein
MEMYFGINGIFGGHKKGKNKCPEMSANQTIKNTKGRFNPSFHVFKICRNTFLHFT